MKILLIIDSLRNGGAEKVVSRLSASFEKSGHEVLVVTFSSGKIDYPVSQLIQLGISVNSNPIDRIIKLFKRIYKVRNIKKTFVPDVSIGFMFSANLVNAFSLQKNELTISTVHNILTIEDRKKFTKELNSYIYRRSDFIIAVSHGIKNDLLLKYNLNKKRVEVINNFVDVKDSSKVKLMINKNIRLISIGRLIEQKAQWHLIHVLFDLRKIYPNVSLTILGEGKLKEKLSSMIKELGLEHVVELKGFQENINDFLLDSDIFCFSSQHEGFGNVLIEAMNMGLPIISTDIPHGPREILNPNSLDLYINDNFKHKEKYGLLVDYGKNPSSNSIGFRDEYIVGQFVSKITLLIENNEIFEHFSHQSLTRVSDFSEGKISGQWTKLFDTKMH